MILVNYSQSHNMLIENEIGRGMVNYITGSLYRGAVHVVLRNDSTTRSAALSSMSWRTPLPVSMKKTWLFPDYSQAEVRVAAWAGPIPLMKQWFKSDEDIHINVARLIGETVEKHKVHIPPLSVGLPPPWGRKHWSLLNAEDPLDHDIERDLSKRSEEHTSELQSPDHLVCRLLLEKKK